MHVLYMPCVCDSITSSFFPLLVLLEMKWMRREDLSRKSSLQEVLSCTLLCITFSVIKHGRKRKRKGLLDSRDLEGGFESNT